MIMGFDLNSSPVLLLAKGFRNLNMDHFEKDFTFVFQESEYHTTKFIADLLSPKISRLHRLDPSLSEYEFVELSVNGNVGEIIEGIIKGEEMKFTKNTINNSDDMKDEDVKDENEFIELERNKKLLYEVLKELENEDFVIYDPIFEGEVNQKNVFERIKKKFFHLNLSANNENNEFSNNKIGQFNTNCQNMFENSYLGGNSIRDEVDFISKNFYELSKNEEMKKLDIWILRLILSNKNLCIESEDSLIDFIYELINYKASTASNITTNKNAIEENMNKRDDFYSLNEEQIFEIYELYEFVEFDEMSEDGISMFIDNFDFSYMNYGVWLSLCDRLKCKIDKNTNEITDNNNQKDNDNTGTIDTEATLCSKKKMNRRKNKHIYINLPNESDTKEENKKATKSYLYSDGKELEGIICGLDTLYDGMLVEKGIIKITSSSVNGQGYDPSNVIKLNDRSEFCSKNEENSWIMFEFPTFLISPSRYSIKSAYWNSNDWNIRNWVVEGSLDGINWTEMDRRENNESLKGLRSNNIGVFIIQKKSEVKFLRFRQIGPNWDTVHPNFLSISSIELFGDVIESP